MATHPALWHLQRLRPLAVLTDAQLRGLERIVQLATVRRRQHIYRPGDPSDCVFLLRSGVVKIAGTGPHGREVIFEFLHSGEVFGELAIVDQNPRDHAAEAYEDCLVCTISREPFLNLMQECPALACQVARIMGHRLKAFRARINELRCRSATARVAHALVELAARHGVHDAEGVVIPLRLSQRDLGSLVGLTRETVNFVLKELRARHLVETDRYRIRLKDPDALRALG